jgi:hypothetical protein
MRTQQSEPLRFGRLVDCLFFDDTDFGNLYGTDHTPGGACFGRYVAYNAVATLINPLKINPLANNVTSRLPNVSNVSNGIYMTKEDKMTELEKVLHGRTLQGAENLRAFLQFVGMKAIDGQEGSLKEYVIATEVFGRASNYDPRVDSVVRVQAGRLRSKLMEYYSTEGKDDKVIIDLPKGHYTPVFSYARTAAPITPTLSDPLNAKNDRDSFHSHPSPEEESKSLAVPQGQTIKTHAVSPVTAGILGAILVGLLAGGLSYYYRSRSIELEKMLAASGVLSNDTAERQNAITVWGGLLRPQEPVLIVYSNTLFQGTAETGMRLLKSLDSPGSSLGSPVLPQSLVTLEESSQPISDHYTGIGEVMAGFFLGEFFNKVGYSARVKRSLLLNWEDLKTENIAVLGSPAENLFLRDLPQKQILVFRAAKDEKQQETLGVIDTKSQNGEPSTYLARQGGRSRSQISEDYAVISLLQGLNEKNRIFILAGITTLGTQAAAEYVTRPEYIKDLISHLNLAPEGQSPRLPAYYQILLRIKVNGGVPVQISYVKHYILSP